MQKVPTVRRTKRETNHEAALRRNHPTADADRGRAKALPNAQYLKQNAFDALG